MAARGRHVHHGNQGARKAPRANGKPEQPHRRLFDRLVRDEDAILRGQHDAIGFLVAICQHDDSIGLLYQLSTPHACQDVLKRITLFVDPAEADSKHVYNFLSEQLIPTLRKLSGDEFALPSLARQLAEVLLAISEAPNLYDLMCAFLQSADSNIDDMRPNAAVLAWFLTTLATILRQQNRCAELARPEVQRLSEILCGLKVPYAAFLRGHMASPRLEAVPANAFSNDSLVPFRNLPIRPTINELRAATDAVLPTPPFETDLEQLIDGQFRLLREALLGPVREDLRQLDKVGFRALYRVFPTGVDPKFGSEVLFTFQLHRKHFYHAFNAQRKRDFWERSHLLQPGALVLLMRGDQPELLSKVAHRDAAGLVRGQVRLTPLDNAHLDRLIQESQFGCLMEYTLVHVAPTFFAFEPVLRRLQEITRLPFEEELLGRDVPAQPPSFWMSEHQGAVDRLAIEFTLDTSQRGAVEHVMANRVALVQGPPGTGKTLVGVVLAKLLVQTCHQRVLLCCFTNHALDQFLMELLDHGVTEKIIRIGGRCNEERLQAYCLNTMRQGKVHWTYTQKRHYHELKEEREELVAEAQALNGKVVLKMGIKWWPTLRGFLSRNHSVAFQALSLPPGTSTTFSAASTATSQDFAVAGRDGQAVQHDYLWERWYKGQDAGVFAQQRAEDPLWRLDPKARRATFEAWQEEIRQPQRDRLAGLLQHIAEITSEMDQLKSTDEQGILASADIIACTTWGAARYSQLLLQQNLPVVMAEEAGEILEAHLLAALPAECRQLILIGDHQQLRPKIEHFPLTKEAGKGYDLNVSLFERLVGSQGVATLSVQHRMRPEISSLVRGLFYPHLRDHPSVLERPSLRGLKSNIIVVNHAQLEAQAQASQRKMAEHQSHSNPHEVNMILRTTRYLLQQDYQPQQIVVLTPYLGQLLELRSSLTVVAKNIGVAMNDRDVADVRQAGGDLDAGVHHEPAATSQAIRVATIDNFQGEEADIIILSLVRSNSEGGIGFLKEPERVNVMLSRAKLGLIIFGNLETFRKARSAQGRAMWRKLVTLLPADSVSSGLSVRCERHPEHAPTLNTPADFEKLAKDGGCHQICGAVLRCGHVCPLMCHGSQHDSLRCPHEFFWTCTRGQHMHKRQCWEEPVLDCRHCQDEQKLQEELEHIRQKQQCQESERKALLAKECLKLEARRTQALMELEKTSDVAALKLQKEELEAALTEQLLAATQRVQAEERQTEAALIEAQRLAEQQRLRLEQRYEQQVVDMRNALQQQLTQLEEQAAHAERAVVERTQREQSAMEEQLRQERLELQCLQREFEERHAQHQREVLERKRAIIKEERRRQRRIQQQIRDTKATADAELGKMEAQPAVVAQQGRYCIICLADDVPAVDGIVCTTLQHFVCDECFEGHVRTIATHDERLVRGPIVRCPESGCASDAFGEKETADHVTEATLESLQTLRRELLERQIHKEADDRVKAEVARELERREALSRLEREVFDARRHITESIFTLKCPRCAKAFVDFDGCFALTCSHCDCKFCAWCLSDCGTNAHPCAASCSQKFGQGGGYYGTSQQFEVHQRQRRQRLLDGYVAGLPVRVRRLVAEQCYHDGADLGLELRISAENLDIDRQIALALAHDQQFPLK